MMLAFRRFSRICYSTGGKGALRYAAGKKSFPGEACFRNVAALGVATGLLADQAEDKSTKIRQSRHPGSLSATDASTSIAFADVWPQLTGEFLYHWQPAWQGDFFISRFAARC